MLSKLFQAGDKDNDDLEMIGFGSGKLRNLDVNEIYGIVNPVSLKKLNGDSDAFINYQGEATIGNCEMVEWIISVETGSIGKNQMKEFSKGELEISSKTTLGSMRVTQNFNDKVQLRVKERIKDIRQLTRLEKVEEKVNMLERMKTLENVLNKDIPLSELVKKEKDSLEKQVKKENPKQRAKENEEENKEVKAEVAEEKRRENQEKDDKKLIKEEKKLLDEERKEEDSEKKKSKIRKRSR